MNWIALTPVMAALLAAAPALADLTRAKAEPNLERRSRLALDNAAAEFRAGSEAYRGGDWAKTVAALKGMGESVDFAYASLKQTGRIPRNSGHHKNLELKLRNLLKNLEGLRRTMAFEEREQLAPLSEHLHNLHDEVLQSIMAPRERKDKP